MRIRDASIWCEHCRWLLSASSPVIPRIFSLACLGLIRLAILPTVLRITPDPAAFRQFSCPRWFIFRPYFLVAYMLVFPWQPSCCLLYLFEFIDIQNRADVIFRAVVHVFRNHSTWFPLDYSLHSRFSIFPLGFYAIIRITSHLNFTLPVPFRIPYVSAYNLL